MVSYDLMKLKTYQISRRHSVGLDLVYSDIVLLLLFKKFCPTNFRSHVTALISPQY